MEKVQLVVDFLLTHKMLFTTLILFFMWLVRRSILSMIRGDHAFLTEINAVGCREPKTVRLRSHC